jgi:serine protease AprX
MPSIWQGISVPRSRSVIQSFLSLTILVSGPAHIASADDLHPKLDPAVEAALAQATATTMVRVIVNARSGNTSALRSKLLALGATITAEHPIFGELTANMRALDLAILEADPTADHVSLDWIVRSTAAPTAPPTPLPPIDNLMLATLGLPSPTITGKGVGVAVIDSGLQPSTDLSPAAFFDFTKKTPPASAYDDYGHGTHISGLIRATSTSKAGGGMVGVSPGVRLISMKVLDATGQGYTSTVLTALESVINNKGSLGIDVVNLSLGHPITEPGARDPLVQAVEAASRKGVVVVVAAGNWGRDPSTGLPAYAGITSPGNAPSAVTVGSFDMNQTVTRNDDFIPPYSSRGPTWYDGFVKPDIVAPGHNLVSLAAIGSSLYTRYPEQRVVDSAGVPRFMRLSGTSMATAVTSGVVALMIERHRKVTTVPLTPNDLKAVLQFTAIPMANTDILTVGAGALNPPGALAVVAVLNGSLTTDLRSSTTVLPVTTIGSDTYTWSQAIIWGHAYVYGDTIYANEPAWKTSTTWGSAVIWGHGWTSTGDILWDSSATWSANTVWNPIVAPSAAGDPWAELTGLAVIWGHAGPF